MKAIGMISLILCYIVFSQVVRLIQKKMYSLEVQFKRCPKSAAAEEYENFKTRNCMLDDKGIIFVICEEGYKPYTVDKFPDTLIFRRHSICYLEKVTKIFTVIW